MDFYGRQGELAVLQEIYKQANQAGKMCVITGRRRIGKTVLASHFAEKHPHLYLFIAKKTERLLCAEFIKQINEVLSIPIVGEVTSFKDIFLLLLEYSKKKRLILIIDEFQEFFNMNPSVYSDIQGLWDKHKKTAKLQVLFIGSVYSLMHKIFEESDEPLFGRADRTLHLKHFSIRDTFSILSAYKKQNIHLLFDCFALLGNVPKYIDLVVTNQAFSQSKIIDLIVGELAPLLHEGKHVLIEEFGRDYGVYFSILELIATGKTARSAIESVLQKDIGGYLDRLEQVYGIINRHRPINAKPGSRLQKYKIRDNFLNFWFRFLHRHKTAVEIGNFDYIKKIIHRDLSNYYGAMLENFYHEIFALTRQYNVIGRYWERDNSNEIDLVAVNDLDKKIVIAEIKLKKKKVSLDNLKQRSQKLLSNYEGYAVDYLALDLQDALQYLE